MSGNPLLNMMGGNNPMAAMMNSPLGQIINMAKSGKGNPMQMIQQMAGQNPQMQNALNMVNGKSPSDMGAMINDLAKQRGVNMKDLVSSLGVPEETIKNLGLNLE